MFLHAERHARIRTLEEQVESLKVAGERFKLEERETKEELSSLERELSVIRSRVTAAQSQVDGFYLIMSRIANNEVTIGAPFKLLNVECPIIYSN